jgi:hypothetical protein
MIRAATRPVLTVLVVLFWLAFIGGRVPYPPILETLVVAVVAWWFVDRSSQGGLLSELWALLKRQTPKGQG